MWFICEVYAHGGWGGGNSRGQRRMSGVLLYHSPLFSFEEEPLTEPETRLEASKHPEVLMSLFLS